MMWWQSDMGWGAWLAMTGALAAFWSLVVLAVIGIFRDLHNDERGKRLRLRKPIELLDERFARGEIDADEYHLRKTMLKAVSGSSETGPRQHS